ncbi:MAG: type IV toxin-antitoxin system AbiEi family antitoxin [Chloroflexi bacterium]|nr:type IV toxin-antitoxin system AbiEi family antitoxin [Chloroflexota bacterium]
MKENNEQKAALQALQGSLAEIPFVRVGKITALGSAADFQVELRVGERSVKILAQYKKNGQPRLARQAVLEMKEMLSKGAQTYGVFIAPYISPVSAEICQQAGIGYLDLAGNCLIAFDTIYIKRDGAPNVRVQRRDLRSLYSIKSERILRVLLTRAKQIWKTETLAESAQVSFGQVANVKKLLADREWLVPGEAGIRLSDPRVVLDEWAKQYRFERNQVTGYYSLSPVAECESQLAELCQQRMIRYALTSFSGAARLAPAVRYQRVTAYIDGNLDVLANRLGWKRVENGANIHLLTPYDAGIFFESQDVGGIQTVSPVQIYLDLQNQHSRAEEAAQSVRKVIEKSWQ